MVLAASHLDNADDTELASQIADGDQAALAEVYRRHSAAVYGLALRVTRDRTLAEEVSQEIFVRIWRRPHQYDPERGTLRTFLLTMTHGRSVDLIRSEASRRRREETESTMIAVSGPTIDEEVIDMQIADHVRQALKELDTDERNAIELAYFGGHSYREVAEILDQPEGTVKSRIRRGLQRMSVTLQRNGITA